MRSISNSCPASMRSSSRICAGSTIWPFEETVVFMQVRYRLTENPSRTLAKISENSFCGYCEATYEVGQPGIGIGLTMHGLLLRLSREVKGLSPRTLGGVQAARRFGV